MDAAGQQQLIEEICAIEGRGPGTDAERRTADLLASRLRAMRRKVELEPFFCHPPYALVHALAAAVAVIGSLVATEVPGIGFGLVLLAATSTYLDVNTRFYLLRRLLFRRVSQNVVSPGDRPEAPLRLILVAHYDAARTGVVFGERSLRLARRLSERGRVLLGPFRLLFWGGLAPLLPILGARMAGIDATWLTVLQLFPTILLVVAIFLLIDIALSEIVPGAYDNASGVAAVLSAAEELDREPPQNLDLWVLLTGSEESHCEGMRSWVLANRKQLDPANTLIVNLDQVSYGTVHYQRAEGAVVGYAMDPYLVELCDSLADADRAGETRFDARPVTVSLQSDALPAALRGLRAISIYGFHQGLPAPWYHTHEDTPDRIDGEALTRATEFVVSLARLIDRDAGRAQPQPETAPPEPAQTR